MFTLTIQTDDITKFSSDPAHKGYMAGTVIAPALSAQPLSISNGLFNLFVVDDADPACKKMKYQMQLHSYDGKGYFFYGYKSVQDDAGFDLWKDTTVLYITVYEGNNASGEVVGKGILKIIPMDFATQMATVKALHSSNTLEALQAIKTFSTFFGSNLINTYFRKLF